MNNAGAVIAAIQTAIVAVQAIGPATPPATLVPAFGSGMLDDHWNKGPADWIDTTTLPKPVPWTNFADPANWILAPSNNGVRPSVLKCLNLYGNRGWIYNGPPRIVNGRHGHFQPQAGDQYANITPRVRNDPAPMGVRGQCAADPYITWRGHPTMASMPPGTPFNPRLPLYVGVDAVGRVNAAYYGDMVQLGQVTNCADVHDIALYESNRALFFTTATNRGALVRTDRTAAIAARVPGEIEDGRLWTHTDLATGFQKPTSVETLKDGSIYVCDELANALYYVDPATGTKMIAASIVQPFWVRRTSAGLLIVATLEKKVHIFDPVTRSLGPNIMPAQWLGAALWIAITVDENGTFGPKDEFWITESHGQTISANVGLWRFLPDGTVLTGALWGKGGSFGTTVGDAINSGEWFHYGWMPVFHPDQGVLWIQGFATAYPTIVRGKLASDATEEPHDHDLYRHGQEVIKAGTTFAYQQANGTYARPSFTALMDFSGWSLLGITCDWMVQEARVKGWAWLEAFIQSGMGGTTPRPEITGRALYGMFYVIVKSSQQYLSGGGALWAQAKAHVLGKYPNAGAYVQPPYAPQAKSGTYLKAALTSSRQIKVTARDYAGSTIALASSTVVDVLLDQGRPSEVGIRNVASPWTVAAPAMAAGPHAVTCYAAGCFSEGSVIEL